MLSVNVYPYSTYVQYLPRTQITHILEDLTHKMEGQSPQKRGQMGSRYIYIYIFYIHTVRLPLVFGHQDFSLFVCSEAARRVLPWPLVSWTEEDDGSDVDNMVIIWRQHTPEDQDGT